MTENTRTPVRASNTRVTTFLECRQKYDFRYNKKLPELPDPTPGLGKAVHRGGEVAVLELVKEERVGPLSREHAIAGYNEAWFQEGMSDPGLYAQGLEMVENYTIDQGVVDHRDVLGVEKQFDIPLGDGAHRLVGVMDLVVQVAPRRIRIVDLKSNQRLYTSDELRDHLQLSLYAGAARVLWPWVEEVELWLWMLRHRVPQKTSRTSHAVKSAFALVEATCDAITRETAFAPTISSSCAYCGYRPHCSAYADAVAGKTVPERADAHDLEQLGREREHIVSLKSILEKRQKEIDGTLMKALKTRSEILTETTKYLTYNSTSYEFPPEQTVEELAQAAGRTPEEMAARVLTVSNGAVKDVIDEIGQTKGTAQASLIEAHLQALAKVKQTPRLWAKRLSR